MAMFLNSRIPYEAYREIRQDKYFVDKTLLIGELIPSLGRRNRYFCITRPRRFGKTVMANMVGAFFGKSGERESLFDGLAIMGTEDINRHLHQHEVEGSGLCRISIYDRHIAHSQILRWFGIKYIF